MSFFDKLLKKEEKNNSAAVHIQEDKGCIYSPVNGKVISLEKLDDGMFSEKILGDGIAVIPSDGSFIAPVSGSVETAFPTGHAYGIKTDDGVEILIHIGIDTVQMNGRGFQAFAKQGDRIKAGDKLAQVNLESIKKAGYPIETMIIVTSGNEIIRTADKDTQIKAGAKLLEVKSA